MRLHTVEERDAAIKDLIETTTYVLPDGTPYEPDELLVINDAEGDEDAE